MLSSRQKKTNEQPEQMKSDLVVLLRTRFSEWLENLSKVTKSSCIRFREKYTRKISIDFQLSQSDAEEMDELPELTGIFRGDTRALTCIITS